MLTAVPKPWRRYHQKSRNGCLRCKARKVKCDEQHPTCRNCLRIGIHCEYVSCRDQREHSPCQSLSPSLSLEPARNDGGVNFTTRARDLKLLHHFVTATVPSFPGATDTAIHTLWSVTLPQMGFVHEFLLDTILSASAFHFSALVPDDLVARTFGYHYFGQAVSRHRDALAQIDATTADPLCLASVLIMFLTFRIACTQGSDELYAPPVDWFRTLHGTANLVRRTTSLRACEGFQTLIQNEYAAAVESVDHDAVSQLQDVHHRLAAIPELIHDGLDSGATLIRQMFWDNLQIISAAAAAGEPRHRVRRHLLTLVAVNGEALFQLIEARNLFMMILLSHYFALLHWSGGNWWFQSCLGPELARLSAAIPPQLRWAAGTEYIATSSVSMFFQWL